MMDNKLEERLRRYVIDFHPVKWWVRGQHRPAIGYNVSAANIDEAKAKAVHLLRAEHPGSAYRFHCAREVKPPRDGCSVCGAEAFIHPVNGPAFCAQHCPDHEYANEGGERLCVTCGDHRPVDWGNWEDTSLAGDRR